MKQSYKLTKKEDFDTVFRKGRLIRGLSVSLRIKKTNLDHMRVGIIVGQRISKRAVIRNRIKRQLREVVAHYTQDSKSGIDVVVMPNVEILKKSFNELKKELELVFKSAKLI